MAAIAKLKQEMQFNSRLAGLLDALKAIAAQQFQTLERLFKTNPVFPEAVRAIGGAFDLEHLEHPFTRTDGSIGVIAVTSDTGLLGGLNQQVVATALQEYRRAPGELIVIGERGSSTLRELGLPCRIFPGVMDTGRQALAAQVRDYALNRVLSGHLGALTIIYARALSFTQQRIELVRVLPCMEWFRRGGSRGVRGGQILLESSRSAIVEYLVWVWLGRELFEVFGYSRLAELGARSMHLEGSCQELERRGQKIRSRYFRERHELIDRNMRELFAARSLYGQ